MTYFRVLKWETQTKAWTDTSWSEVVQDHARPIERRSTVQQAKAGLAEARRQYSGERYRIGRFEDQEEPPEYTPAEVEEDDETDWEPDDYSEDEDDE